MTEAKGGGGEFHQPDAPSQPTDEELLKQYNVKETSLSKKRYDICLACEDFRKLTRQCKICNCFMFIKTKLTDTACPKNKW